MIDSAASHGEAFFVPRALVMHASAPSDSPVDAGGVLDVEAASAETISDYVSEEQVSDARREGEAGEAGGRQTDCQTD